MNPELEEKVNRVIAFIEKLEKATTIPLEVDAAFRERLEIDFILRSLSTISVSAKGATTENKSVRNAADTGSTSVLDIPDGFVQVNVSGTVYYIPMYTS